MTIANITMKWLHGFNHLKNVNIVQQKDYSV